MKIFKQVLGCAQMSSTRLAHRIEFLCTTNLVQVWIWSMLRLEMDILAVATQVHFLHFEKYTFVQSISIVSQKIVYLSLQCFSNQCCYNRKNSLLSVKCIFSIFDGTGMRWAENCDFLPIGSLPAHLVPLLFEMIL